MSNLNIDLFYKVALHDPAWNRLKIVGEDSHAWQLALSLGQYCEERNLTSQVVHDILSFVGLFLDVAYPYGRSDLPPQPNIMFDDDVTSAPLRAESKS